MNHAQAVILATLDDDKILTLRPEIARRHLPVLREWASVGGVLEYKQVKSPDWSYIGSDYLPTFLQAYDYRLPVRRIEITGPGGTYSYPEPLRVAPAEGTQYYVVDAVVKNHTDYYVWNFDDMDNRALSGGFVHLTREAAEEHAKALILAGGGAL